MPNTKRTQQLHGCGSVRGGARQLASLPRRVRLLHLLTAGIGTGLPNGHVRIHGESWRVSGPCAGVFGTAAPDPQETSDVQCNRLSGCRTADVPAD
jgi:hypothetical protein